MQKQYREMVNTRRLYKFEGDFFYLPAYRYLTVQINLSTARNIAKLIWYEESDGKFLILRYVMVKDCITEQNVEKSIITRGVTEKQLNWHQHNVIL